MNKAIDRVTAEGRRDRRGPPFGTSLSRMLCLTLSLAILPVVSGCAVQQGDQGAASRAMASSESTETGTAAVAMPDRFSADAARAILEKGGNAVDAAIAASFVLAVTLPEAGNIGGGGFMTLVMDGEADFLDYRETAPAAADRDMYLDENGEVIEDASEIGGLASGIPGTVAGMVAAHEKYGSLPWRDLVEPAIALARDGFELPEGLASRIARSTQKFAGKTNFADYFKGETGDLLVQTELAETLERIADKGNAGFYEGETAAQTAATMVKTGGLITQEDMAGYEALWRTPLTGQWRDYTVVSAPPPSSGGVALMQLLGMKAELAADFEGLDHNSPQYIHLIAEIEKRVFADRAEYLGDPDFTEVPVTELVSPDYIKRRAGEVSPDAISSTPDVKPGLRESFQTTHFSILDYDGNGASVTTTLNTSFGSGVVVEGAGYLMNNEMDDFSMKPGVPNVYGVIGGEANAIAPGKRMLSSMTPTILMEDDAVAMVVGTPGGPTIFTSVFQAIVNHVEFGMTAAQAVGAGRFHHQLLPPNMVFFERRIENFDETSAALEAMGYNLRRIPQYGDVHAITIVDGVVDAAADPRGRGASMVFER